MFELIGLSTGMPSVIGSHAEWPAKGRFTRIRLVITNNGRNSVPVRRQPAAAAHRRRQPSTPRTRRPC